MIQNMIKLGSHFEKLSFLLFSVIFSYDLNSFAWKLIVYNVLMLTIQGKRKKFMKLWSDHILDHILDHVLDHILDHVLDHIFKSWSFQKKSTIFTKYLNFLLLSELRMN